MKFLVKALSGFSKFLGDEPVIKAKEIIFGDKSKKFEVTVILMGILWFGKKMGYITEADINFWMQVLSAFGVYFGILKMNKFKKALRNIK